MTKIHASIAMGQDSKIDELERLLNSEEDISIQILPNGKIREIGDATPVAIHASDCALHNEPAFPAGPCDCGVVEDAKVSLLLTVARILRAIRYEHCNYCSREDVEALDEALKPWSAANTECINEQAALDT